MLYSLLIKVGILGMTLGVVLWIGWSVPQSRLTGVEQTSESSNPQEGIRSTAPLATSETAVSPLQPQRMPQALNRSVEQKLDLNRATEQDFEALPGIGPVLAERIVEYRQARGAFRDVEQLRRVKGIGKKKFERIRSLVGVTPPTVPAKESKKA